MHRKLFYAYPGSHWASWFGFRDRGCYVICRTDAAGNEHGPFQEYETIELARAALNRINLPDDRYSHDKVTR